jgi:hypothetical protein
LTAIPDPTLSKLYDVIIFLIGIAATIKPGIKHDNPAFQSHLNRLPESIITQRVLLDADFVAFCFRQFFLNQQAATPEPRVIQV